jgi:hypothetical protein
LQLLRFPCIQRCKLCCELNDGDGLKKRNIVQNSCEEEGWQKVRQGPYVDVMLRLQTRKPSIAPQKFGRIIPWYARTQRVADDGRCAVRQAVRFVLLVGLACQNEVPFGIFQHHQMRVVFVLLVRIVAV